MTLRAPRLALTALTLASCGQSNSGDGYRFESKEWDQSAVTVTIVQHPSLTDLRNAHLVTTGKDAGNVMAWSTIAPSGRCTVHVVDPTKRFMAQWIGHEIAHCAWGNFHPGQDETR